MTGLGNYQFTLQHGEKLLHQWDMPQSMEPIQGTQLRELS